ncbi:MAG: hypothetical protein HY708_05635 [Ignavibacteriae bacterium]|nr:hypothetical protein [Ignavibacteriota bacterium]
MTVRILSYFFAAAATLCLVGTFLPETLWRDAIISPTQWGSEQQDDLLYVRIFLAGFGLVMLGWSLYCNRDRMFSNWFTSRTKEKVFLWLFFILVAGTALIVARFFITFHDHVRIIGPKTPFSNWGEFLGVTVTVPFEHNSTRDDFNGLYLAVAGSIALFMSLLRIKGMSRLRDTDFPTVLWVILSFGFLWASVDELVMIHELMGPNLPIIRDAGLTKYPDDLIMMMYAAAGLLVLLRYLKYFFAQREAFVVFIAGAVFQGLAAINGLPGVNLNEESYEMLGGLCFFVAMFMYAMSEIQEMAARTRKVS